jgi:hypothetical protein
MATETAEEMRAVAVGEVAEGAVAHREASWPLVWAWAWPF